jgi:hypothetical protein
MCLNSCLQSLPLFWWLENHTVSLSKYFLGLAKPPAAPSLLGLLDHD